MKRPWQIWLLAGGCLALVTAGLVWLSVMALTADRLEAEAQAKAALEENVRLALWRMESALAGVVVQESNRPYFEYTSFHPLEQAYTRMFSEGRPGEVLVPSRLLTQVPPYVQIHFQIEPNGAVTSPQVPQGTMRDLAEAAYTDHERIDAFAQKLADLQPRLNRDVLLSALPEGAPPPEALVQAQEVQDLYNRADQKAQAVLNQQEFEVRERSYKNIAAQRPEQQQARKMKASNKLIDETAQAWTEEQGLSDTSDTVRSTSVRVGAFQSIWMEETLILVRRVDIEREEYIQGAWLDWAAMKAWLLGEISDLFPAAGLLALSAEDDLRMAHRLAALPVKLAPGASILKQPGKGMTPIRIAIVVAWICLFLAVVAVTSLLRGVVALSERRGAFVSAVTHELRTPLTTLRLYTDLLAEGMVSDPDKETQYLRTLQTEADRLGHLVENVLTYSRLERRGLEARKEEHSIAGLLAGMQERLSKHAKLADLSLKTYLPEKIGTLNVKTDAGAVEQILFNLVDNACKYAAAAEDKTLHLQTDSKNGKILIRIRDHGPGIRKEEARRLFQPFRKSAYEAAGSAPGVGLGLALSRRLAREMGGDLILDHGVTNGACFVLTLPAG